MNADLFRLGRRNVRLTDSNSLLRLYDQARILCQRSGSPQERARAEKAIQILTSELGKRNVPV
jgi:hypothetical protein